MSNGGLISGAFSSTSGKADTVMNTNGQILYYNNGRKALDKEDNDEIFNGHSSKWESKQIALIFSELGYNVDVINWGDSKFVPEKYYDEFLDVSSKGKYHNKVITNNFEYFNNKKMLLVLE